MKYIIPILFLVGCSSSSKPGFSMQDSGHQECAKMRLGEYQDTLNIQSSNCEGVYSGSTVYGQVTVDGTMPPGCVLENSFVSDDNCVYNSNYYCIIDNHRYDYSSHLECSNKSCEILEGNISASGNGCKMTATQKYEFTR